MENLIEFDEEKGGQGGGGPAWSDFDPLSSSSSAGSTPQLLNHHSWINQRRENDTRSDGETKPTKKRAPPQFHSLENMTTKTTPPLPKHRPSAVPQAPARRESLSVRGGIINPNFRTPNLPRAVSDGAVGLRRSVSDRPDTAPPVVVSRHRHTLDIDRRNRISSDPSASRINHSRFSGIQEPDSPATCLAFKVTRARLKYKYSHRETNSGIIQARISTPISHCADIRVHVSLPDNTTLPPIPRDHK